MGTKLIVKNWGIFFFKLPLSLLCVKAACEICLQLGTLLGGTDALRQPQTIHSPGVVCRSEEINRAMFLSHISSRANISKAAIYKLIQITM